MSGAVLWDTWKWAICGRNEAELGAGKPWLGWFLTIQSNQYILSLTPAA